MWWVAALLPVAALAALGAPSGLNTTSLKATSFTLKWSAVTGATAGIAGYDVYQGGVLLGSVATRSFAVTGLAPLTTYSMTVIARDGAGHVSLPSAALSVTTAADTTNPSKPANLLASNLTTTAFRITWMAATDNIGVTSYNIYRAGVLVGTSVVTTFDLTGLAPDTNHRMTVKAVDAAGNVSGASAALVVRTLAEPPSIPTGLTTVNLKPVSFTLKWLASTGGTGGIAGYDVYQNGALIGTPTNHSLAVVGLAPQTTYSLTVASRDTTVRVSPPSAPLAVTTPADTTKPTAPGGLSASAVTGTSFTLMWTASTDNVGVTAYDVFRNGVQIGSTPTLIFAVKGLTPSNVSSMRVKARDVAGNISGFSAILSVTTSALPNVPPVVTLTAPATGATLTAPAAITLAATATDSDGTIAKVEFFDGTLKLGEALVPSTPPATFTLPFTLNAVGFHFLTARATDNQNATTESAPSIVQLLPNLPYVTDFEQAEGYLPGSLDNQQGWTVAAGTAQITTADSAHGDQSIVLDPGAIAASVSQEFGASTTNSPTVFFDLFAKPVAGEDTTTGTLFDIDNARLAFILNGASGQFTALDGDGVGAGTWVNLSPLLSLPGGTTTVDWQRVTLRLYYPARTWDFYLNDQLIAIDLKFRSGTATYFRALAIKGHPVASASFDDIYAGPDNPLFIDADRDGMADAWETAHGLNPVVNDRNGDPDGDGLTNIQEFLIGTNPNNADSDGDGLTDGQERTVGTDPNNPDSDGDSLPDGWEKSHGLNPRFAADASLDNDGDGQTNAQEYAAGTNPVDYYNGRAFTTGLLASVPSSIVYTYDVSGRVITASYGSSGSLVFTYDAASNLVSVASSGIGGSGGTAIIDWRTANGLPADGTGAGADTAILTSDGLPNLAKYAFGLDPHIAATGDFPSVSLTSIGGSSYLTLSYRRPDPAAGDLIYTVAVSTDGTSWSSGSGATVPVSTSVSNGNVTVVVRDATAVGAPNFGRRIRLSLERRSQP